MTQVGPPRFTAVGETVELAPWNPDPQATYQWELREAPAESEAVCGGDAVIAFTPDVAGRYQFALAGPTGTATQTVRAFPNCHKTVQLRLPVDAVPDDATPVASVAVVGAFNNQRVGRSRPQRKDDEFVFETTLPPGEHHYGFCFNGDLGQQVHDSVTVEGPGRPRCQLAVDDSEKDVVVTADPTAAPDSEYSDEELAVEFVVDDRDTVTEAVTTDDRTLRIPRDGVADRVRVHAVAVGERHSVAETVEIRVEGEAVSVARPNRPPTWAESPTVYEIFVRSFAGETLQGTFQTLEERVEYLESLAIDVVWLTPVVESPTDHGYHVTDYFATAADLGSREEFESFIQRCHDAGIRVMFDLVINHTSRDHPAFHLHSAGVDSYSDYYNRVPSEADVTGIEWAGEGAPEFYFNWEQIPNLNYGSLAVRQWMHSVVEEWADVVDGFRCDIAWGVPHGFWQEVADSVPTEFLMLDETIPRDPNTHEQAFQMHYDTELHSTLRAVGRGEEPASRVFDALDDARWQGFPDSAVHLRYVENHDETRYLAECGEPALRAAAAVTFTLPGAPMIYYGQERGMTSQRGPMKWYDGDSDLTTFHRSLATLRREEPALRTGSVEPLSVGVLERARKPNTEKAEKSTAADSENGEEDGDRKDKREDDDSENRQEDDSSEKKQNDGDSENRQEDDSSEKKQNDGDSGEKDDDNEPNQFDPASDDLAAPELTVTTDPTGVIGYARDNGEDRLIVICNFSEKPQLVELPTAVGDTDCRRGTPLRKRQAGEDSYILVDSVVVCRPTEDK